MWVHVHVSERYHRVIRVIIYSTNRKSTQTYAHFAGVEGSTPDQKFIGIVLVQLSRKFLRLRLDSYILSRPSQQLVVGSRRQFSELYM